MAFINPNHRGTAYGDGYMQGEGKIGQVVKIIGDDRFEVNTDPSVSSFGILIKDYKSGEMPGIYMDGGVYETDTVEGVVSVNDKLKVSSSGYLTGGVASAAEAVAQVISVKDSIVKFKLHL